MKKQFIFLSMATMIGLSGCENGTNSNQESKPEMMNHESMNHSNSGEVPESLKVVENPTYEVGSQVILKTDHMEGMKGAVATIVGAFETIAYVISYTPTTGGETVENHKWVIQEEIENAGDQSFEPGTVVTIIENHMKGMKGASAKIVAAELTTLYMVDYTPTTGGEKVTNHKWLTESELSTK